MYETAAPFAARCAATLSGAPPRKQPLGRPSHKHSPIVRTRGTLPATATTTASRKGKRRSEEGIEEGSDDESWKARDGLWTPAFVLRASSLPFLLLLVP
eukprot:scaffold11728_cov32-Tisochrysis_lutea.AAC.6